MQSTRRKPPRSAATFGVAAGLVGVARDMARTLASSTLIAVPEQPEAARHAHAARYFRRLSQLVDRLTAASRTGMISQRDVAALSSHLRKYPRASPLHSSDLTSRWLLQLASELTSAESLGEPVRPLERAAQLFATIADLVDASSDERRARRAK